MLREGGMLLYSTCTFSPEENEQTIEYLLNEYPQFEVCEIEGYGGFAEGMPETVLSKDERLRKTVRIFPHRMKGEGHFLALLRKGSAEAMDPARIDIRGDKVYYMPEGVPPLKGIRFLRTGLLLGELKKKRFEPSQAFAMNLKKEEYARVLDLPVSDERVVKYLKGETLDVEDLTQPGEKGWYLRSPGRRDGIWSV